MYIFIHTYCILIYGLQIMRKWLVNLGMSFFFLSYTMATEGYPTDLVKVLHLLVLSFTWGMQLWVSFIAGKRSKYGSHGCNIMNALISQHCIPAGFALVQQVTLHTFGLVQSKLFPVYFYCLLGSNFVSLAVYAVYHPRELLDWHESVQVEYYIWTYDFFLCRNYNNIQCLTCR